MRTFAFKESVSAVLAAVMLGQGIPVANAGPLCSDLVSAANGTSTTCSVRKIGSNVVGVPKLVWKRVSDSTLQKALASSPFSLTGEETAISGNRSALALGLSSNEVAAALQTMPTNVPFVVGRFDPLNATLKVEILKVERFTSGGVQRTGLFSADFTPEHGDIWKAARYYISPSDKATGAIVGVNPFTAFDKGDGVFRGISFGAAKVVMGHAMRHMGAPTSLLMSTSNWVDVRKEEDGDLFTKKVTFIYDGKVKPQWFVGQPSSVLRYETAEPTAAYCVSDISATNCPIYASATAGVSFEQFTGGMFNETVETYELKRESHRGLTMIGAIAIAVLASYAMTAAMGAIGSSMSAGAAGTATTGATASVGSAAASTAAASASSGAVLGGAGSFVQSMGWISGGVTTGAGMAIEVGYATASTLALGGGSNSMYKMGPQNLLGFSGVQRGLGEKPTDELNSKLGSFTAAKMTSSTTDTSTPELIGYTKTITGDCSLNSGYGSCVSSGTAAGVIVRNDQYIEQNTAGFIRENRKNVIRDASKGDGFYTMN